MASQPRLARVLLLGLVAGWLRAAQPRDFTVKDIVYLHPSSKHGPLLPKGSWFAVFFLLQGFLATSAARFVQAH